MQPQLDLQNAFNRLHAALSGNPTFLLPELPRFNDDGQLVFPRSHHRSSEWPVTYRMPTHRIFIDEVPEASFLITPRAEGDHALYVLEGSGYREAVTVVTPPGHNAWNLSWSMLAQAGKELHGATLKVSGCKRGTVGRAELAYMSWALEEELDLRVFNHHWSKRLSQFDIRGAPDGRARLLLSANRQVKHRLNLTVFVGDGSEEARNLHTLFWHNLPQKGNECPAGVPTTFTNSAFLYGNYARDLLVLCKKGDLMQALSRTR